MVEFRRQELANFIASDARPSVLQDLLLNRPIGFSTSTAGLGEQDVILATVAKAMIILAEGLAVGLMKPIEIGSKAEREVAFRLPNSYSWIRDFHYLGG